MKDETLRIAEMLLSEGVDKSILPEGLTEISEVIQCALKKSQTNDPEKLGMVLALEIGRLCGGRSVYIPTVKRAEALARNQILLSEYYRHGVTVQELSIRYKMAPATIYNILNSHSL